MANASAAERNSPEEINPASNCRSAASYWRSLCSRMFVLTPSACFAGRVLQQARSALPAKLSPLIENSNLEPLNLFFDGDFSPSPASGSSETETLTFHSIEMSPL